jgi:ABC-2 type transport system ATP-binding protein
MPEPSTTPMVSVQNVSKRFGRTLALDGVSLEIDKGETYAILGPNGSGKTTLIHILCTIHGADSGTARIGGYDVRTHSRQARQRLGVVFQEPSVDTRLTVYENLDFHGRIYGVPRRLRRQRIEELLELVELADWRDHLVRALSKGMQRRLEIGRALVHDAELLVLDEPTVGLDAQSRSRMWQHLAELKRLRNLTVLVTTHYIEEVESTDRVCVVDRGKVLTVGTPRELKERHGRSKVRLTTRDASVLRVLSSAEGVLEVRDSNDAPPWTDGDAPKEYVAHIEDGHVAERLLAELGSRLVTFSVEQPTLEDVFLDLTGRGLRDSASGTRDRLAATPRSGGEPIR